MGAPTADDTFNALKELPPTLEDGCWTWRDKDGKFHRDNDLPARIYVTNGHDDNDGSKEWWRHGQRHRDHGRPAVIQEDGAIYWWIDGLEYNAEY